MSEMASPADWRERMQPMAGHRWPIRCGHVFTAKEIALLREGLWPRDMDDRWAIWLQGDVLRCWRSLSGVCIYEAVAFISDDGSGVVSVVDVLDEAEHYSRATSEASELERFEGAVQLALRP